MTLRPILIVSLIAALGGPATALTVEELPPDGTSAAEAPITGQELVPQGREVESGDLPPLDASGDDPVEPADGAAPPTEGGDEPAMSPGRSGEGTGQGDGEAAVDGPAGDADADRTGADAEPDGDDDPTVETEPFPNDDESAPEPRYDLDTLPRPVARMRELLLEAALAGDVDRVALLAGIGDEGAQLSLVPEGRDAGTILRQESGDGEGFETLAILAEVLEAGYVVLDEGEEGELYLWPWFAAASLDGMTPEQKVAMFRILTAADRDAMEEFGGYVFYRLGIDRDGIWRFFVAGD